MTAVAEAPAAAVEPAPVGRKRRTDAGTVLLGIWGVLGFLFLFFPVLVIVAYSFNEGRLLQSYRGFGLGSYVNALNNSAITSGVQVSIYVGVVSAIVAAVLGSLAGVAVARRAGARWIGWLTALLPWFVTLGTDWGFTPLNSGIVRLIIAHSLFSCAVVTFIVRARMAGLSESLEEAAADLGAPPVRRFFDITFPLMRPAVISGALLSFTLSLDNTVLSSFVSTADATPFPVYVFASVRSSLRPEIAAMSTLMLLLTLVALGLVAVVLISSRRRTGEGMSLASTLAGG